MADLQDAKRVVRAACTALDSADPGDLTPALAAHVQPDYRWRGMHPFHELSGANDVAETFWSPLKSALGPIQRRPDIFMAGHNQIDHWTTTWVVEMGHLAGNWNGEWLGLTPSRKLAFLRYVEFHRIKDGLIAETACYIDILNLLAQAGRSPVHEITGLDVVTPGPRDHGGLLHGPCPADEGRMTVELIAAMIAELRANLVHSPGSHLKRFWTADMCWFGPGGIGASVFQAGYRRGHCDPFEKGLAYVRHTEHIARIGEGMFGGFFGYPSLTMRSNGYLGFPASDVDSDMRIVDLYRREGDRLAENWIFIDLPHFFAMQGIDLLAMAAEMS